MNRLVFSTVKYYYGHCNHCLAKYVSQFESLIKYKDPPYAPLQSLGIEVAPPLEKWLFTKSLWSTVLTATSGSCDNFRTIRASIFIFQFLSVQESIYKTILS